MTIRTAVTILACCFASSGCSDRAGRPSLRLPEVPVQLGEGMPGEELTAEVRLKNTGQEMLRIEKPGCACSSLSLTRYTIPAGEDATLRVAARLRHGEKQLHFPVRVHSNDPGSPVAVFFVTANAGPAVLRTEAAEIDLGEVSVGTAPLTRFKLLKPDGSPWPGSEPVTIDAGKNLVRFQIQPAKGVTPGLVVDLRPVPELGLGLFEDTLTIRPKSNSRSIQVPVRGQVVPAIIVAPTALYFGDVDSAKGPMRRILRLRRTDGKALTRMGKAKAPAGLCVEETALAPSAIAGYSRNLEVTLNPALLKEDLKDGRLLLWLEGEEKPVEVRVMAFLTRKKVSGA